MSSSNPMGRRVAPAAQARAYLQAVLRTRSRVSSGLEQPAMDASLAFSWLSQFSSTWLAPPQSQRGSRPRVSSATGGCWTRHTTARCCALLVLACQERRETMVVCRQVWWEARLFALIRSAGRREVLTCPREERGSVCVSQSPGLDARTSPLRVRPENGNTAGQEDSGRNALLWPQLGRS